MNAVPNSSALFLRWVFAAGCAVVIGGLAASAMHAGLRNYLRDPKPDRGGRVVPGWLTGLVERAFFLGVVAFRVNGGASAMIAWIGIKMLANWNSPAGQDFQKSVTPLIDDRDRPRHLLNARFTALLPSLVGMGFTIIGGSFVTGDIPANWISAALMLAVASIALGSRWQAQGLRVAAAPEERIENSRRTKFSTH